MLRSTTFRHLLFFYFILLLLYTKKHLCTLTPRGTKLCCNIYLFYQYWMISILLYTYPGAHRVRFGPSKTFCGIYIRLYIYIYIGVIDTFQTTFLVRQFELQWTCNLYQQTNKRRGFSVFFFSRDLFHLSFRLHFLKNFKVGAREQQQQRE